MMHQYSRCPDFARCPGPCCNTPWQPVQAALHRVVRGDAHAGGSPHLHGLWHPNHFRLPARLSPPLEDREVPHRQGEGGAEGKRSHKRKPWWHFYMTVWARLVAHTKKKSWNECIQSKSLGKSGKLSTRVHLTVSVCRCCFSPAPCM